MRSFLVFPLATNLAVNLGIKLPMFFIVLDTFIANAFTPSERSTNFQMPFPMIEAISSFMPSFHKKEFGDDITSSYVNGPNFTLKKYEIQLEIEHLEPLTR